jgi:hypothetical protein
MEKCGRIALALWGLSLPVFLIGQSAPEPTSNAQIPKPWNDVDVESYELPLSYGKRAQYMSAAEYYAIPARTIYRAYPIYRPDKEPRGYLNWLRTQRPTIIFDPAKLKTEAAWVEAGATVFDAPNVVADLNELPIRDPDWFREANIPVTKDGIVPWISYVVRKQGVVEIGFDSCGMCHTRVLADGSVVRGAQGNFPWHPTERYRYQKIVRGHRKLEEEVLAEYRKEYAAPWASQPELLSRDADALMGQVGLVPPGVFIRHGARPAYPARIPDLIGIRDRRYLDSTGLGQHRRIEDLMRYAITNQTTDRIAHFNGFQPWPSAEWLNVTGGRYSDEQLYALGLYIYSLKPPPNPNKFDAIAMQGQKIFDREGCAVWHTPPLYTNNKLTPAQGFSVPEDHKKRYDILPVVVGTDPKSALTTRRGTGYYKVPSLQGVWYRGRFEHNGSVATLEDWFNPARLREDYVPTGFKGYGVGMRAVKGHEFGLHLSATDKQALIAFLRTL